MADWTDTAWHHPARCPGIEGMEDEVDSNGGWVACEHPERPPDARMFSFPYACEPCEIATKAAIALEEGSCANCGDRGDPGHHWLESPGCYVCYRKPGMTDDAPPPAGR